MAAPPTDRRQVFAYLWLVIVLVVNTPHIIDVWEVALRVWREIGVEGQHGRVLRPGASARERRRACVVTPTRPRGGNLVMRVMEGVVERAGGALLHAVAAAFRVSARWCFSRSSSSWPT